MSERRLTCKIFAALLLATASYSAPAQEPSSDPEVRTQADVISTSTMVLRPRAAKAPHVTCQRDQLTIFADNSTMNSIFTAIRACLAIDMQVPKGFDDERTFITLGPAPTRDVLNEFLRETDFDYVIQSSEQKAGKIESIQVTARVKDAGAANDALSVGNLTMTPARRLWMASRTAGRPVEEGTDHEAASDGAETATPALGSTPAAEADSGGAVTEAAAESKNEANDRKQQPTKELPLDASGVIEPATVSPVADVPAAHPDSSEATQAAEPSVLQKQINQMEHLFEQRKQMTEKPVPASASDPVPN